MDERVRETYLSI